MSVTATLFLTFVGLLVIGAPITLSLGAAALAGMITSGMPIEGLVEIAYTSVNSFPIMALPAFILSGALMESAGISRRLVAVAEVLAGVIAEPERLLERRRYLLMTDVEIRPHATTDYRWQF